MSGSPAAATAASTRPAGAATRSALFERVGWWQRLAIAAVLGVLVPFLTVNDFQLQVGINALLLALLALGLNVAVGWAGLLDLGYIAFYGFGAYGFALLSSNQLNSPTGIHLDALVSVPIVMVAAAVLGLVVGLPSRRLIGDYLAIITLFFGEAFVEFTNNVAPSKLGGPNGIIGIDPYKLPIVGQLTTNKQYFYLLLALLVISIAVLHLLDTSRTGRAWRAVREDPLAAGMMTIPVNRVKLMAFSFGAVVAALAGTVFAAQQISVFPTDFDTPFLILIYAALILGGAGSIGGAVLGGLVVSIMLDGFLRSPTESGYLFYGIILLTLDRQGAAVAKARWDRASRRWRSGSRCTRSSRRSPRVRLREARSQAAGSPTRSGTGSSSRRTPRPPATSASSCSSVC